MTPIEQVIRDPSASDWLKRALESALQRDPIDAANDAEILAELLRSRGDAMVAELRRLDGFPRRG
ncbi:hypothetical protein [Burkholderia sp. MBR-1]|uniref:hypothetical protein n=1 Tax=Burkholderia sp. MBR-1 TaxID=2732364 RepID=UPI0015EFD6CD|nr:hypothetical protein [Burkholderia sp. MBR-1]QMI49934.1 hypothetical protein MBR110_31240 [Burkholderia sp. MBR-1]